MSERQFGKNRS